MKKLIFFLLLIPGLCFAGNVEKLNLSNSATSMYGNLSAPSYVRAGTAWAIRHGVLVEYGANEVVFDDNGVLNVTTAINEALYNRDFSHATWTKTNVTPTTATDLSGNTTTIRLTADANDGTALQTVTLASAEHTTSCYLKRVTGTGAVYTTDDNSNWTERTLTTEFQRFDFQRTQADPVIGIKFAASGDAVDCDLFQVETKGFPTASIPTSDLPITRTAPSQELQYTMSDAAKALFSVDEGWDTSVDDETDVTEYFNSFADSQSWFDPREYSATYTSDFSAGVDGWTAYQGAVAGNIDTIGGEDNWLRYTINTLDSQHNFIANRNFIVGKTYKILFRYFAPSTNSSEINNSMRIRNYPTVLLNTGALFLDTPTTVSLTFTAVVVGGLLLYFDSANSFQDVAGVDVFYIKDFTIEEILSPASDYTATGSATHAVVIRDSTGVLGHGFIGEAGTGETLGSEIATGTLTVNKQYVITATQADHFYTGCAIGEYWVSDGTETCDVNNKVQDVTAPPSSAAIIYKDPDLTAEGWVLESAFDVNDVTTVDIVAASECSAEGSLVGTWTPGVAYGSTSGDSALIALSAAVGLLYQDDAGLVASYDATTEASKDINYAANTSYPLAIRWGYLTSGVPQFQVGVEVSGSWTWGTEQDFDGRFASDGILRFFYSNDYPSSIKNIAIIDQVWPQASLENYKFFPGRY